MDEKKVVRVIPYIMIAISVIATLYVTSVLTDVENQCNVFLKERQDYLIDNSCKLCNKGIDLPPTNLSIKLPPWATVD